MTSPLVRAEFTYLDGGKEVLLWLVPKGSVGLTVFGRRFLKVGRTDEGAYLFQEEEDSNGGHTAGRAEVVASVERVGDPLGENPDEGAPASHAVARPPND